MQVLVYLNGFAFSLYPLVIPFHIVLSRVCMCAHTQILLQESSGMCGLTFSLSCYHVRKVLEIAFV